MALENLKAIRGEITLEQLSGQTGISVSQLSRYEAGKRDPSLNHLRALAEALQVSIPDIINVPTSVPVEAPKAVEGLSFYINVMGKIGAGAAILPEVEQLPSGGLYEIETPFTVPDGAIAFEVEGDSMWPRYDPGDVIVCWRQGSNLEEVIGWEAAVRTADGHRYLKRILKGSENDTFDLESHNAPPIRGVRLEWVAQVHAVVRADMWKHSNPKKQKKVSRSIKKLASQL